MPVVSAASVVSAALEHQVKVQVLAVMVQELVAVSDWASDLGLVETA